MPNSPLNSPLTWVNSPLWVKFPLTAPMFPPDQRAWCPPLRLHFAAGVHSRSGLEKTEDMVI